MDDRPVDVTTLFCQKGDYFGNFLRTAYTSQENVFHGFIFYFFGQVLRHLRIDKTGSHGIHQNISSLEFPRQRSGEGIERRFFHRVGNLSSVAGMADNAGNINDAAGGIPEHELPQNSFGQVPDAARQRPLLVKLLHFHGDNIGIDGATGIVDQNIDTSRGILKLTDHRVYLPDVG